MPAESMRCTARWGRTILCQFSTALLARTVCSQSAAAPEPLRVRQDQSPPAGPCWLDPARHAEARPTPANARSLVPIAGRLALEEHRDRRQSAPDEEVPSAGACSPTESPSARWARPLGPLPPTEPARLPVPVHALGCS